MLDLASLSSVRSCAAKMVAKGQPLDLLINNAGVMDLPTRRLTEDGFEMQFEITYLGDFVSPGCYYRCWQIPIAAGNECEQTGASGGKIDFDNLQAERKYYPGLLPAVQVGGPIVHLSAPAKLLPTEWVLGADEQSLRILYMHAQI